MNWQPERAAATSSSCWLGRREAAAHRGGGDQRAVGSGRSGRVGRHGADEADGFEWAWIELLEFLSESWQYPALEDGIASASLWTLPQCSIQCHD